MFSIEYFSSLTPYIDVLKNSPLPIFIYGMGDGCAKLAGIFERYKIPCAGIFASDEFVRDKTFLGHKIRRLADIERQVEDFIIVLAFGAGYASLIEKIDRIAKRHRLIVPDMPVVGDGLFTIDYLQENFGSLEAVYRLLADSRSRLCYESPIEYRITGDISCLKRCETSRVEAYSLLRLGTGEIYADLGAYTGDTVAEFASAVKGKYLRIYAVEPDRRNFRKLTENTSGMPSVTAVNAAAGDFCGAVTVAKGGGRMIKKSESGISVPQVTLDSVLGGEGCTYIKYDVEGAEMQALRGSGRTIAKYKPKLNVALYHRVDDIFKIPLYVHSMLPEHRLYIRHFPYYPAWDTNLYAVPAI